MSSVSSLIAESRSSIVDTFMSFAKTEKTKKNRVRITMDEVLDRQLVKSEQDENPTLSKSLTRLLNGGERGSVERLAFETDPGNRNSYQSVYRAKTRGVPDALLKRIMIQDDLVATIVRARETHVASFGRPRPDRFSTGFVIEPLAGIVDRLTPEKKAELDRRIEEAVNAFSTCGATDGLKRQEQMSFSTFLKLTARNAVGVGRIAIEVVHKERMTGEREFHHFRPVDAGTVYYSVPQMSAEQSIRETGMRLLEQLKDFKYDPSKFVNDEYAWVQVIENTPRQMFTDEELIVHNFYPVLDVEQEGYPVTPIDTMLSAVTTHINITTHNKMYFQTGRATRGMLVFKSDDVDENTLARVKQQFQASINSVNNAWRMPVFAVGSQDEISWESIDNSGRDAEFQYLTDMNARVILSAFQMSPDELPGWSYLSRGTNNQALSETNNEYRLEAARDLGIRPLLAEFEDIINNHLFPLIDFNLSKLCRLKLKGLDADTEEKESIRLQQDGPVHGTYDWILSKVEKKPVGKLMGGDFPMNPQFQAILDKYKYVDEVVSFFFGGPKDPNLHYIRDPFYFQNLQMQMQQQQMQQQAQAQQQQAAGGGGAAGGGAPNSEQAEASGVSDDAQPAEESGGDQPKAQTENQKSAQAGQAPGGQDLSRSVEQAIEVLTKSEHALPASKRKLLAIHRRTLDNFRLGLQNELSLATKDIVAVASKHARN